MSKNDTIPPFQGGSAKFRRETWTTPTQLYRVRVKVGSRSKDTDHSTLAVLAHVQGGVVTPSQARRLGYSWRRLDTLAKRRTIVPLLGQWVVQSCVTVPHIAVAHALTLRLGSAAIITGAAAAQCLGASGDWPDRFGVAQPIAYLPAGSHRIFAGVQLLRCEMDGEIVTRGKLRIADWTTALLDCIDLADDARRESLVDHLLQKRWLQRDRIDERVAARRRGRQGRRATPAQVAAKRQAADGTESVAERLLKRLLRDAGLRRGGRLGWVANHVVQIRDGGWASGSRGIHGIQGIHGIHGIHRAPRGSSADSRSGERLRSARIDFAWSDCQLAIEVDGRAYHSDDDAFEHDRERRNDLEGADAHARLGCSPNQHRARAAAFEKALEWWVSVEKRHDPTISRGCRERAASGALEASAYALKLDPQPQLVVALGLLNTNPRPMISFLKSIVVPLR